MISLFGFLPPFIVSIEIVGLAVPSKLHRERVWPERITQQHITSSSLCAAGMTSFGPTAAKRLDDVRCA